MIRDAVHDACMANIVIPWMCTHLNKYKGRVRSMVWCIKARWSQTTVYVWSTGYIVQDRCCLNRMEGTTLLPMFIQLVTDTTFIMHLCLQWKGSISSNYSRSGTKIVTDTHIQALVNVRTHTLWLDAPCPRTTVPTHENTTKHLWQKHSLHILASRNSNPVTGKLVYTQYVRVKLWPVDEAAGPQQKKPEMSCRVTQWHMLAPLWHLATTAPQSYHIGQPLVQSWWPRGRFSANQQTNTHIE